ncbi:MAG: saccharopine dehydrogenase NADP-binding domain-containing protein [Luteimonas sp.]
MLILVLGGYGHFGGRICRSLAHDGSLEVLVAGRSRMRAEAFIAAASPASGRMHALALDVTAADFAKGLRQAHADVVIHAAGPFQGCDYRVAEAAMACGAHYIDLADAREFVANIAVLDPAACNAGRWVISGASSVPGLSAAVVQAHLPQFGRLEGVEVGISPGNRTPRGEATTRAILGYVGKRFASLDDGRWRDVHGWQSLRRIVYPDVGARWLARCEVPDLSVLPQRYPQLRHCDFRAGLELRRMHFGLWLGSWLVRAGAVPGLQRWTRPLLRLSNLWLETGSNIGVMHVDMHGSGHDGLALRLRWTIVARDGDGPQIPCTAAILLAKKLAIGALPGAGARPCLDLFTLDEFLQALHGYAIRTTLERLV